MKQAFLLGRSENTVQRIQGAGVAISAIWLAHQNTERPEHQSEKGCVCNAPSTGLHEGLGTHPRPGVISKTRAVRPSRTRAVWREQGHWRGLSCVSSRAAGGTWKPLTSTSKAHWHLHIQRPLTPCAPSLCCGLSESSGSWGWRRWWEHQKTLTSEELLEHPTIADTKPLSSWAAGKNSGKLAGTAPETVPWADTEAIWPPKDELHTSEITLKIHLSTPYRNPSRVLLLVVYLTKPHVPHANKPRGNTESRMQLISTNANEPFKRQLWALFAEHFIREQKRWQVKPAVVENEQRARGWVSIYSPCWAQLSIILKKGGNKTKQSLSASACFGHTSSLLQWHSDHHSNPMKCCCN